jgi:hypothetical protein
MAIVYVLLVFASRIIKYALAVHYAEQTITIEIWTFAIVYIMDAIAIYAMMKIGRDMGIAETLYVVILNVFPFAFFYLLGVAMISYTTQQISNIINFIQM